MPAPGGKRLSNSQEPADWQQRVEALEEVVEGFGIDLEDVSARLRCPEERIARCETKLDEVKSTIDAQFGAPGLAEVNAKELSISLKPLMSEVPTAVGSPTNSDRYAPISQFEDGLIRQSPHEDFSDVSQGGLLIDRVARCEQHLSTLLNQPQRVSGRGVASGELDDLREQIQCLREEAKLRANTMTGAAQRSHEQLTAGVHDLRVQLETIEAAHLDHQAKSGSTNDTHAAATQELQQEVEVSTRRMGELRREFQELRSEVTQRHQSDYSTQQLAVDQLNTDLASLSAMHKRSTDELLGPIVQSLQHEVKQLTLKVEELTANQENSTQKSDDLARLVDKLGITVSEVDGKRQFLVNRLEKLQMDTVKMNNTDDLVERVWPKVRLQLQEADLLVPSPQRISALVYEKTAPLQSSIKRLEQELDQATKRSAQFAEDLERLQLDERIASVAALGSAVENLKAKHAETATQMLTIAADAQKARYMAAESLDRFPENYDWSQEEERLLQHDALLTQLEERVNMHQEWLDREQDMLAEQSRCEKRDAQSIAALELAKKNSDNALIELAQRCTDIESSLESTSTIAKAIAQGSADSLEEALRAEIKVLKETQDGHAENFSRHAENFKVLKETQDGHAENFNSMKTEIVSLDQEHKELVADISKSVCHVSKAVSDMKTDIVSLDHEHKELVADISKSSAMFPKQCLI
jgi:chromosome segregation ATPase